jgi:hypothetical protein
LSLPVEVGVLRRLPLVEELLDPLVGVALRVKELHVALEAVVPDLHGVLDLRGRGEHVLLEVGVAEQGDELPLLVDALLRVEQDGVEVELAPLARVVDVARDVRKKLVGEVDEVGLRGLRLDERLGLVEQVRALVQLPCRRGCRGGRPWSRPPTTRGPRPRRRRCVVDQLQEVLDLGVELFVRTAAAFFGAATSSTPLFAAFWRSSVSERMSSLV